MAEQVKVNQTNLGENMGEYLGNHGPYQGINFKVAGDFHKADWHAIHYIKKIPLTLTKLNYSHRVNIFACDFCGDDNVLEIHVATGDISVLPSENFNITFNSDSNTEVSLDPNNSNEKINVKFIVYAYDPVNKPTDLYFSLCGGPKRKISVYTESDDPDGKKDYDPQPDTKDGSIIIGT